MCNFAIVSKKVGVDSALKISCVKIKLIAQSGFFTFKVWQKGKNSVLKFLLKNYIYEFKSIHFGNLSANSFLFIFRVCSEAPPLSTS